MSLSPVMVALNGMTVRRRHVLRFPPTRHRHTQGSRCLFPGRNSIVFFLSTLTGKIRGFGTQLRKKCQKKLRCVFCNSTVERLRSKPTNVIWKYARSTWLRVWVGRSSSGILYLAKEKMIEKKLSVFICQSFLVSHHWQAKDMNTYMYIA